MSEKKDSPSNEVKAMQETETETKLNEGLEMEHLSESFDEADAPVAGEHEEESSSQDQAALEKTLGELEEIADPEKQLQEAVLLMEKALAQSGNPDFKAFWEVRKRCLELFKKEISSPVKALYWKKYRELTIEAKRLKDFFEEKTAFAVEQIDKAIAGVESEVANFDELLSKYPAPKLPAVSKAIKEKLQKYKDYQKELNLLNSYAVRVNTLRKELIRTEMRIRYKNNFFQRLSLAGDKIFPKRKELIKEISRIFVDDVESFIKANFENLSTDRPIYPLFDEIKSLQILAKFFTLNTNAFTHTRFRLSECWDKLREKEKVIKAESVEKKQVFQKNEEIVKEKLKEFMQNFTEGKTPLGEAQRQLDEISKFMRTVELGRHEVKALKDELNSAYNSLKEKLKAEEKKKRELEFAKEQKKQEKIDSLEGEVNALLEGFLGKERADLEEALKVLTDKLSAVELSDLERDALSRRLTPVLDYIAEQEQAALLAESAGAEDTRALLKKFLNNQLQRRAAVKEEMDRYRKVCGSSGLDFEQSLYYNEQLSLEKVRFEKINEQIQELEKRLKEVK